MLDAIKQKHAQYESFMGNGRPGWLVGNEDKLSDAGWLSLVAVPWLLEQMETTETDRKHIELVQKSKSQLTKQFHMTAVETDVTLKLKAELDDDLNALVFDSGGQLYVNEEWCFRIQLLRHLKAIAAKE